MQPVIFGVPREASPAGHKRVIAVTDRVGGKIAQVRRRSPSNSGRPNSCIARSVSLLRHAQRFVAANEDQLWTENVMGLEQHAIPSWILRTGGQRTSRRVVVW